MCFNDVNSFMQNRTKTNDHPYADNIADIDGNNARVNIDENKEVIGIKQHQLLKQKEKQQ